MQRRSQAQKLGEHFIIINSINLLILILIHWGIVAIGCSITGASSSVGNMAAWHCRLPTSQTQQKRGCPCNTSESQTASQRACTEQLEKGREDQTVCSYCLGDQKDERYGTFPALRQRAARDRDRSPNVR